MHLTSSARTGTTLAARRARTALGAVGLTAACLAATGLTGCLRRSVSDELENPHDPIPIHVHNENFLDVNVYVVSGSARRRLGTVTGNSDTDFEIDWDVAHGQPISLVAQAIGSRESVSSGDLTVGSNETVYFRVGSVLRQSVGSVVPTP